MPEINVTRLITDLDPNAVSGSIATHGKNAARNTWENATANATDSPLDIDDRDGVKDWARRFGAWEDEEIDLWSDAEMDALVLQYAAGDLKELQDLCPGSGAGGIDWREAESLAEAGTIGGSLFASGSELFISLD